MRSINLGRWSRYIERYFNIKGGSGVIDVEQAIRHVLPIQSGNEDRYLQSWNRFAAAANIAAVASAFGRFRIRNPTGSNVIFVIERLTSTSSGATADQPGLTYGAATTDLANLVSLTFTRMDPRGNPQPTAVVSQIAQAAGGQLLYILSAAQNTNAEFIQTVNQEIPVLPGQVVELQSQVANQIFTCSIMWRERAMEASELT